jgi:hypothetical protein
VTTVFSSGVNGKVCNFYEAYKSSMVLYASLAQNFPAVVGKNAIERKFLSTDPGSNFMQQPFLYPSRDVHSVSFTQFGGGVRVAISKFKLKINYNFKSRFPLITNEIIDLK